MRQLTFGYLSLAECSQPQIIDAAAAAGFESVGLRVEERRSGDAYPHIAVGNPAAIRAIRQRLMATGMRLSNVIGRYLVPDTTAADLEGLVDTGAELGCSYVLANGFDPDEGRTVDNLAQLCAFANDAGIRVAVEFVPYQHIRSLDDACRMILATGADNAGLVPDPLHLSRSGGSPSDFDAIDPERIFYAQICDAPAARPASIDGCLLEARTGRLYPGEGGLPLVDYVRAMPADCEIEVEVANAQDRHLSPVERATKVGIALRRFIAGVDAVSAAAQA